MKKTYLLLIVPLLISVACAQLVESIAFPMATATGQSLAPNLSTVIITPAWLPVTASAQALATKPPVTNGRIARQHIEALSEAIGSRVAGTPAEAEAAQYVQAVFRKLGYAVHTQPFSFEMEDEDEQANPASNYKHSQNAIALKPGLSTREIIVGAHYDSAEEGKGADDNASGVGVMLEVAELLRNVPTPYTIRFIAFGAEEVDLNGSSHYVD